MSKRILHIDLHPIATDSRQIDAALQQVFAEAQQKRVKTVEIITGKGSGQLKKRAREKREREVFTSTNFD